MTEGAGERQGQEVNDDFGLSALREVLRLINDSDITEIKIERGGAKLHIRRGAPPAPASTPFMITPSLAAALPHAMPPQVSLHRQPAQERPTPKPTIMVSVPGFSRPWPRSSPMTMGIVEDTVLPQPSSTIGILFSSIFSVSRSRSSSIRVGWCIR